MARCSENHARLSERRHEQQETAGSGSRSTQKAPGAEQREAAGVKSRPELRAPDAEQQAPGAEQREAAGSGSRSEQRAPDAEQRTRRLSRLGAARRQSACSLACDRPMPWGTPDRSSSENAVCSTLFPQGVRRKPQTF